MKVEKKLKLPKARLVKVNEAKTMSSIEPPIGKNDETKVVSDAIPPQATSLEDMAVTSTIAFVITDTMETPLEMPLEGSRKDIKNTSRYKRAVERTLKIQVDATKRPFHTQID